MMGCDEIRERIDELTAKRESVPAEERLFHDHIAQCESCRRAYEQRRAQIIMLNGWPVPEARGNIQARVMAGIAQIERERSEQRTLVWAGIAAVFTRRFQIPAAIAVGLAVVLAGSIALNLALLTNDRAAVRMAHRQAPAPTVSVARTAEETQKIISETASRSHAQAFIRPGISENVTPLGIILILGAPPLTDSRPQTQKTGI